MRLCPRCHASYSGNERYCVNDAAFLIDEGDARRVGETVGNYRITDVIGSGGMGTVYRAEHVYIGKPVAIKVLHERFARFDEAIQRFLREARAASAINHPNIVDVTDFGPTPDGGVYIVLEYLDGESLEQVIAREAPLELHRAINVVDQIASALAAAHVKGIIHRDLKPENVMLIQRPGRREVVRTERDAQGRAHILVEREVTFDFVKILDFGIAKVLQPEALQEAAVATTLAGTIVGTPEYMSPEAAKGLRVDGRSDIYALGVIFYELLTRQVPFEGDTPIEVLAKHLGSPPPRPRDVARDAEITEAAERLILKALAKNPAHRQQSMDELRFELQTCYGSVAYRRHVDRAPGASRLGVAPRRKRLTEELDEWLQAHRAELEAATRRLEAIAADPGLAEDADEEPAPPDPPDRPVTAHGHRRGGPR